MQYKSKVILFFAVAVIIGLVLAVSAAKIAPEFIVKTLTETYPGLEIEKVEWHFFTQFKLTNISYTSERFTFKSDVSLKLNPVKLLLNPLSGVSELVLEQPYLKLHSQDRLTWEKVQQLIWVENLLPQLPTTRIEITAGEITFNLQGYDVQLPIEGTVWLGSETYLDLDVWDLHFDQIIVFKDNLPQFGSGLWEFRDLVKGQQAWHIDSDRDFVLDYFKAENNGYSEAFYLWAGSSYIRGQLPDFDAVISALRSINSDMTDITAQVLDEGKTPRLTGTADRLKLTWLQNGRWQELSAALDKDGIVLQLLLDQFELTLDELPVENLILGGDILLSSSWQGFLEEFSAEGTLFIQSVEFQGVEAVGEIEFSGNSEQLGGSAHLDLLGGTVDFNGSFGFTKRTAAGKFKAADLNLAELPFDYHLAGLVNFTGQISGNGRQLIGELWVTDAAFEEYWLAAAASEIVIGLDQIQINNAELSGIGNEQFTAGLTGSIELQSDRVLINNLEVETAGGILAARGILSSDGLDIDSEAADFPLELVTIFVDNPNLTGLVDYQIHLAGKFDQLNGHGQARVREVYCDLGYFPALSADFRLEQGQIHLQPLSVTRAGAEIIVEGSVSGLKEPEFDLRLKVPRSYLEDIHGFIEGSLTITGTLTEPQFDGRLTAAEIAYPVPYFDELTNGELELIIDHNLAAVSGSGSFGRKGKAVLQGTVDITAYDVNINMKVMDMEASHPLLHGVVDGELHVSNVGSGQQLVLHGDLIIDQARVYLSGLTQSLTGKRDILPVFGLNIEVSGEEAAVIGPGIRIAADGKLKVTGTSSQPAVQADIRALGGTANLLGTTFEITSGRLHAADWLAEPRLYLAGTAAVDGVEIVLAVEGEFNELNWTLDSNPALTQHDILSRLNWLRLLDSISTEGLSGDQIWEIAQEQVNRVFSGMEQALRSYLHLDLVQIDPDIFNRDLNVAIGKYIRPDLYLGYQRSFFAAEVTENLDLEYQLPAETFSTGMKLKAGIDNQGDRRFGLELQRRF